MVLLIQRIIDYDYNRSDAYQHAPEYLTTTHSIFYPCHCTRLCSTVKVKSNPNKHQHVLSARFSPSARVTAMGARVRLAGKGRATIEVVAETLFGKVVTVTSKTRHDDGVDFSDEGCLTKRFPLNVKFLEGPIGTSRSRLWKKGEYTRKVSALIYHPMTPQMGNQEANLLTDMEIQYRNTLLGKVELGDAMSNDPYLYVSFMDSQSDTGPMRIQWKDSKGNIYEPSEISVK